MRASVPYQHVHRNLAWTRSGAVWAGWRIKGLPFGGYRDADKAAVADLHELLWRSLPAGESLALGVVCALDPARVVERMLEGIAEDQWGTHPAWLAECEATLDRLDTLVLGQRVTYLLFPLSNLGWQVALDPARAVLDRSRTALNLPPAPLPRAQIEARLAQAEQIQRRMPAPFRPTPMVVAEMAWLWEHACSRGLVSYPFDHATNPETRTHPVPGTVISAPLLDEGAVSDLEPGIRARVSPLTRRVVKVSSIDLLDRHAAPSYQSLLALSSLPAQGMTFPGCEYLGRIDECGVSGVDWAVRIRKVARETALRKTAHAVANLNDQYDQREAALTTGQHALDAAGDLLSQYQQILATDPNEAEINHTTIFAVPGADADAAQSQAQLVQQFFTGANCTTDRPVGEQTLLWQAMNPGTPRGRIVTRYEQKTTTADFALACPFVDSSLGDTGGPLLLNVTNPGLIQPLHLNTASYSSRATGGNLAVTGEKGSGKSVFLKVMAGAVVARGGQVLVIDRTPECEYAQLAAAIAGAAVVDTHDSRYTADPLQLFGIAEGADLLHDFLTVLTGLGPNHPSGLGQVLADALDPSYLRTHQITTASHLVTHLAAPSCTLDQALQVASRVRAHAKKGYARVVFGEGLARPDLSSPFVIFRTHGLELASAGEMQNPHQFDQLRAPQLFGVAYYALLAAIAQHLAYRDRARHTALLADEASFLTSSPTAEGRILSLVREARRANAGVWLASQLAGDDLGTPALRSLIETRIAFRQPDLAAAGASVQWMFGEAGPEHEDVIRRLVEDTSPKDPTTMRPLPGRAGEFYLRHANGTAGWGKVPLPANPSLAAAVLSDPPSQGASRTVES